MSTKDSIKLPINPKSFRVGCIGGGQLGRMMALEAPRLNIEMSFLDPSGEDCPAAAVCGKKSTILKGGLNDEEKLRELAKCCDVVTCEIEHIGTSVLEKLEEEGVNVQPSGRVVKVIQDKYIQKVRKTEALTSTLLIKFILYHNYRYILIIVFDESNSLFSFDKGTFQKTWNTIATICQCAFH